MSVLENQQYSAAVTVTQLSEGGSDGDVRSFTLSTHQMLGATCSLKITARPADLQSLDLSGSRSSISRRGRREEEGGDGANQSALRQEPRHPPSGGNYQNDSAGGAASQQACEVTAIMTMIPYQFFVKLLGIMCCLCLLKYRARMAMERDLEDLAAYCEKIVSEMASPSASSTEIVAGADCDGRGGRRRSSEDEERKAGKEHELRRQSPGRRLEHVQEEDEACS